MIKGSLSQEHKNSSIYANQWMWYTIYIYIYYGYWAIKMNEKFSIYCNMDGPGGYYAKWTKSDRERQILYAITYMWNLKKTTNKWI